MAIHYSLGNEDVRSELTALRPAEDDLILCIGGSGDRVVGLLSGDHSPGRILCVDNNPAQLDLCRVKMAALTSLETDVYLKFMGIRPMDSSSRAVVYKDYVRDHIPPEFHQRVERTVIAAGCRFGLALFGRLERTAKVSASISRAILGGPRVNELLESPNPAAWVRHWAKCHFVRAALVNAALTAGLWASRSLPVLLPPLGHVTVDGSALRTLKDRLTSTTRSHRLSQSITASLFLCGSPTPSALPPYLREERLPDIRRALESCQVSLIEADVVEVLESTSEVFDAFSLSDCISYMREDKVRSLFEGIIHRSRCGSRFVLRQFLTQYDIPGDLAAYLMRDPALEQQLMREDTSFIYTFMAGTVHPPSCGGGLRRCCATQ